MLLEQGQPTRGLPEVVLAQGQGSLLGCFGSDPAQLCQPTPAEPGALWRGTGKCVSNSSRWHSTLTNVGMNTFRERVRARQPPVVSWECFSCLIVVNCSSSTLRWSSFLRQGGLLCPKPCLVHQPVCSGCSGRNGAHPTGGYGLCKSWKRWRRKIWVVSDSSYSAACWDFCFTF